MPGGDLDRRRVDAAIDLAIGGHEFGIEREPLGKLRLHGGTEAFGRFAQPGLVERRHGTVTHHHSAGNHDVAHGATGLAVDELSHGALYGSLLGTISVDTFFLDMTFMLVAMPVVGGLRSVAGAVVGVTAVSGVVEIFRPTAEWRRTLVDLDAAQRQLGEQPQRRIAGSKVVKAKLEPADSSTAACVVALLVRTVFSVISSRVHSVGGLFRQERPSPRRQTRDHETGWETG